MTTKTLYEQTFSTLPREEQVAVLSYGSSLRLLDLRKRLSLAQSKIREFEARYGSSLLELDAQGLPDNADVAMHEDFILWHHWEEVAEEAHRTIQVLEAITGDGIPLREMLHVGLS